MQKTEQFQTALVRLLAAIEARPQQTVDALDQTTAAPGAAQHLCHGVPRLAQLLQAQADAGFIQTMFPLDLPRGAFGQGPRTPSVFGFDLPQARQGLPDGSAPAFGQRRQGAAQDRLVAETTGRTS